VIKPVFVITNRAQVFVDTALRPETGSGASAAMGCTTSTYSVVKATMTIHDPLNEWASPVPFHLVPTAICDSYHDMPSGWTGLPLAPHPGAYGAHRHHHIHEGVDLYVPDGTLVTAVEDGRVAATVPFTGALCDPPSPWWEDTWAVMIEGPSGVVLYGEIEPEAGIHPGVEVRRGQKVGAVTRVLRKDKGRPRSMVHIELHASGSHNSILWAKDAPRPDGLRDPTPALMVSASRDWNRPVKPTFVKAGNLMIPISSIEYIDITEIDRSEISITWGGGRVAKALGLDATEALAMIKANALDGALHWRNGAWAFPSIVANPMAKLLSWSRQPPVPHTSPAERRHH
jgi:hypothetical protein